MLLAAGQNGKSIELEPLLAKGYQLILLVPAMNEEGIIEQTMRLFLREIANLPNVKMVIIDDASSDDTALLVKNFSKQAGGRIQLLQRQLPQAQTGKGNALNWAYQQVILDSRDRDHLICGVLDADAYMAEEIYQKVIQYFAQDEKLDLLQTRVGMLETRNWLQIMQDIEFTVINDLIQNTRNRLGNAAASGNGQFIRVSSVTAQRPWGNALLEDFEFSTRFLMEGKKTLYAEDAVVYQEAIDKLRPFIKQRARWTQGGLDCLFGYWSRVLRSPFINLPAKAEMTFYMLIPFVTLFTGIASLAVFVFTLGNFDDYWQLLAVIVGINLLFNAYIIVQYQRASHTRQYGSLVWTVITFAIYNYLLYPAIVIAFFKKISGRTNWVKTTHGIKRKIGRKVS
ncbi:glycosyltransferase [Lactiplantibacillus plantarum]|uniref:glycosyltransferase family 2 protein n=1 Tax=Lactiplantibacillus plantarum TaxID=1590 RepID=UPI001C25933A|nr:glycosyltransferase [Lactiplantibacillus plantarum]MBU8890983.1 glycosyltransferase [Lactiplantibacillus plantarum]MDY8146811.1 glycosyltransferase [Lactiplantibacillus plantarum]